VSDKKVIKSVSSEKGPKLFIRESSGLIREMTPYSAFAYNIMSMEPIAPWVYLLSAAAFPGSNIPLGILLTGAFVTLSGFIYATLGSVMPRTGGDYLFQSRVLSPWIGFPVVATMVIFWLLQWSAIAGWFTAVLGLAPLFTGIGLSINDPLLINIGTWFTTPLGIWITTVVGGGIAIFTLTKGLRLFVKMQWPMWYGLVISFITLTILFLITPHPKFITLYNQGVNKISPNSGDFYNYVINYEQKMGFNPNITFSMIATLGVMPIALTSLGWTGWAQYQAGEIKQAMNFKKQLFINLGAGVTTAFMMATLGFALVRAVGYKWLAAAAWGNYVTGNLSMPIPPWFSNLAMVLTANPILIFLATIGILLNGFQTIYNVYIGQTRMAFASAMDRILPEWFFKINEKTGTPINAPLFFYIAGGIIYSYIYNFVPGWITYTLAVTAVSTVMFFFTSIAGALLPYRFKELYEKSEAGKYKVFGIPVVTIAGIIYAFFVAWMLYYYLAYPTLGVAYLPSELLMVAVFAGFVGYFAIRRWYVRNKLGIPMEMIFKEIPPD
jgi:Amino acid transporters